MMEIKKLRSLSLAALIVSIIPLATLIPVFLKITLSEGIRTVWAGINIVSAVVGLILSVLCVKDDESRSPVNIAATMISVLWCLLMIGIVAMALIKSSP